MIVIWVSVVAIVRVSIIIPNSIVADECIVVESQVVEVSVDDCMAEEFMVFVPDAFVFGREGSEECNKVCTSGVGWSFGCGFDVGWICRRWSCDGCGGGVGAMVEV